MFVASEFKGQNYRKGGEPGNEATSDLRPPLAQSVGEVVSDQAPPHHG